MTQREEILQWLNSPRSYDQGIDIYQRYGFNLMLKQMFRRSGRTKLTEMTLIEELRKLANLTENELKAIKPSTAQSVALSQQPSTASHTRHTVPDTTKQAIRFRERFPFLNEPSCPDVLKVAVADMFTAYGRYKEAHAQLQTIDDAVPDATITSEDVPSVAVSQQPSSQPATKPSAAQLSQDVVENYLLDRELWAELEYYRDHGTLLGKAKVVREYIERNDIVSMDDMTLLKQLQSAKTQLSKAKAMARKNEATDTATQQKAAAQTERWIIRKHAIEQEIKARKKK